MDLSASIVPFSPFKVGHVQGLARVDNFHGHAKIRFATLTPSTYPVSCGNACPTRGNLGTTSMILPVVGALAATAKVADRRNRSRRCGFGPVPYEQKNVKEAQKGEIGSRVAYVVCENQKGIGEQLRQYGYSQVDGFLGCSIHGHPDQIRIEMKKLFDRGWFEQESEDDGQFKVGAIKITNQDQEHRFRSKMLGAAPGDDAERAVETQYEVAPTVVNFVRSLLVSLAGPIGRAFGGSVSTNIAAAEMMVLCGNGARYDRRVSQEFGWNTDKGWVPDPRKLIAFYFVNPEYKEELGGNLQLEGVITPTGAVNIAPMHDRLVMFWADKTVWSIGRSQASLINEHHYCIMLSLMAEDHGDINYDPKVLARWFPELQGEPMDWIPPVKRN